MPTSSQQDSGAVLARGPFQVRAAGQNRGSTAPAAWRQAASFLAGIAAGGTAAVFLEVLISGPSVGFGGGGLAAVAPVLAVGGVCAAPVLGVSAAFLRWDCPRFFSFSMAYLGSASLVILW